MIDYFLAKDADGPVTIELKDSKGASVRKYSSDDPTRRSECAGGKLDEHCNVERDKLDVCLRQSPY